MTSTGCSARSTSPSSLQSGTNNDFHRCAFRRIARTIRVGALTRVEGEGALHVELRDGVAERVELNIYEPPRFFEAFLRGRAYTEPPDITARICGICPVAYQTSACNAIEDACGVTLDPGVVALRRLLYCGEWIHSHALHIYMLHAPDFLGYPDVDQRGARPPRRRRAGAGAEEGRQPADGADRRALDPPDQRAPGRVLFGAEPGRHAGRWPSSCAARSTMRWRPSSGSPGSSSPT